MILYLNSFITVLLSQSQLTANWRLITIFIDKIYFIRLPPGPAVKTLYDFLRCKSRRSLHLVKSPNLSSWCSSFDYIQLTRSNLDITDFMISLTSRSHRIVGSFGYQEPHLRNLAFHELAKISIVFCFIWFLCKEKYLNHFFHVQFWERGKP